MEGQPRRGKRWKRFKRKYGNTFMLGFFLLFIIAFVALLMWFLTDMQFRSRPSM